MTTPASVLTALSVLILAGFLAGCEKAVQGMYDQPRYKPYAGDVVNKDRTSARTPPAGSVVHAGGPFAATSSGEVGEGDAAAIRAADAAQSMPYPMSLDLLEHGQGRYDVYCAPCHSIAGDGDGMIARRGFPSPPSYHTARLREAGDRHLYDVISRGYGLMPSFANRIDPRERWAIVAYIRALQLSQNARADELPQALRRRLQASTESAP